MKHVQKPMKKIFDYERERRVHLSFEERYHDLEERLLVADRAMREGNTTVLERVLAEAVRETGRQRLEARTENEEEK